MTEPSFMTIGDASFFHTIRYSLGQVRRFYPDARMFVYDRGFAGAQAGELRKAGATVVPWTGSERRLPLWRRIRIIAPLLPRNWKWFVRTGPVRLARNLTVFADKPACIRDCVRRAGTPLVFLDGDAFLVDRIDDALARDFNVGVTMRRMHEIRLPERDGECSVLNVGVMFFKGPERLMDAFIHRWNDEIDRTDDYCIEQTALTNLIRRTNPDIYDDYNTTGDLELSGGRLRFLVLPCENYNFNWIEEGFDPVKNKILHFKGGRHSLREFEALRKSIGLEERTG